MKTVWHRSKIRKGNASERVRGSASRALAAHRSGLGSWPDRRGRSSSRFAKAHALGGTVVARRDGIGVRHGEDPGPPGKGRPVALMLSAGADEDPAGTRHSRP